MTSSDQVPYPRREFDLPAYVASVRSGRPCFICEIVAGVRDQPVVYRDEICIAFMNRYPTVVGYVLVAPVEHRVDVVTDFTEDEYLELQRRVHRIGRAVSSTTPTERLYVLSLGSRDGNAHVHWHVAPLPPGVAYEDQQFASLMPERTGYLDVPPDDQAALAQAIARHLAADDGHDPQ